MLKPPSLYCFFCDSPSKVIQILWCNIINSQNIFNRWANENEIESNSIASITFHSAHVLASKKCSFILHPSRVNKVILFIQKCYRSSLSKKKTKTKTKTERERKWEDWWYTQWCWQCYDEVYEITQPLMNDDIVLSIRFLNDDACSQ